MLTSVVVSAVSLMVRALALEGFRKVNAGLPTKVFLLSSRAPAKLPLHRTHGPPDLLKCTTTEYQYVRKVITRPPKGNTKFLGKALSDEASFVSLINLYETAERKVAHNLATEQFNYASSKLYAPKCWQSK